MRRQVLSVLFLAATVALPAADASPASAAAGDLTILNRLSDGSRPEGEAAGDPDLSADGSRTVFATTQALEPTDDNGTTDVYLWDKAAGLQRISRTSNGDAPDGASFSPAISSDGRYIVFSTYATDVVTATPDVCQGGGCADVVRMDTVDGSIDLLTPTTALVELDRSFVSADISGDGGAVVFVERSAVEPAQVRHWSADGGLAPAPISVYPSGEVDDWGASRPRVSRNGRWVVFESRAPLTPDDVDGSDRDVFRFDRATSTVDLASRPHATEYPGIQPMHIGITADGTIFYETASVECDYYGMCNWWSELFARSASGAVTTVLSDYRYFEPFGRGDVSDDGRYVLVSATRLDRQTGERLGVHGLGAISGDGSHVAGSSLELSPDPYAGLQWWSRTDVFLYQFSEPAPPPTSSDLAARGSYAPSPMRAQSTTAVDVTVDNLGTTTATGVTLQIDLDPTTTVLSVPANCSGSRSAVRCAMPALAPGESATVHLMVSYKRPGTATHRAAVSWAEDGDASNDTATTSVVVTK